ncbi:MAG: transporter substrate-binding protein [Paenibacillus sp.]|nr:transporter substrate-binding protein [Paenibacillus sp.]
MKTINRIGLGMLAAAMLTTAFGCSQTTTSEPNGKSAESTNSKSETLKVAFGDYGNSKPIKDWLAASKKQFEEQHKGVTVEFVPINAGGNDYYTKLTLMLRSEQTSPDVVYEDSFMIGPDVKAGYLQPIPGIDKWPDWNSFYPAMQNIVKTDGKIYGVMNQTDVQVIYYSKKLFEKAGLPIPWQPKNWQEIITAAQAIKKVDSNLVPLWLYTGKVLGEAATFRGFQVFLWGTENSMYNFNTNKWVTGGKGFDKTWKFLEEVSKQGLIEPQKYWTNSNASAVLNRELMPKHQVGIVFDGSWIGGNYLPTGPQPWPEGFNEYGVAKIPTSEGQSPSFTNQSGGWALSISAKAKNADLAAEFIKTASSKDNLALYNSLNGSIPPRSDVESHPDMQKSMETNKFLKEAVKFVAETHYRPSVEGYPQVSELIARLTGEIAVGNLTAEKAAEQYAKEVTKIAGADKVEAAAK